ncbi:unnamed protein product [Calicophoron daubneyi]|uniref:BZIP domain-containing protein n=1 Tax=Calicophoron daubneyi TaxID=300641 RepID=A0AAV2TU32_CALDB
MGLTIGDEELVKMSTSELRVLLEKRLVTPEEHRELRCRRRRLQNRKYARKCARKKLTEVEKLTTEVEEETTELQALRRQLNRINLSTQRMQQQMSKLAQFRQTVENVVRETDANPFTPIRMLSADGKPAGTAHLIKPLIKANDNHQNVDSSPLIYPLLSFSPHNRCSQEIKPCPSSSTSNKHSLPSVTHIFGPGRCRVRRPDVIPVNSAGSSNNSLSASTMPAQLVAGPGMPSSSDTQDCYGWPSANMRHLQTQFPLHLVRPVGGGLATHGRGVPEY